MLKKIFATGLLVSMLGFFVPVAAQAHMMHHHMMHRHMMHRHMMMHHHWHHWHHHHR